jgi:hypothetical protein
MEGRPPADHHRQPRQPHQHQGQGPRLGPRTQTRNRRPTPRPGPRLPQRPAGLHRPRPQRRLLRRHPAQPRPRPRRRRLPRRHLPRRDQRHRHPTRRAHRRRPPRPRLPQLHGRRARRRLPPRRPTRRERRMAGLRSVDTLIQPTLSGVLVETKPSCVPTRTGAAHRAVRGRRRACDAVSRLRAPARARSRTAPQSATSGGCTGRQRGFRRSPRRVVAVAGGVSADIAGGTRALRSSVAGFLVGVVVLVPPTTETREPRFEVVALPHGVPHLMEHVLRQHSRPDRSRVDHDGLTNERPATRNVPAPGINSEDDNAFHAAVEAELCLAALNELHRTVNDRLMPSSGESDERAENSHVRGILPQGHVARGCTGRQRALAPRGL